ncbi:MAG: hypothetical protein U9O55_03490 [Patescibacteria group bacterium]|nr:hypothetical protein [Patescibacteria group bacterium]
MGFIKRIDCPLMKDYDAMKGKKDIRLCDDYHWTIRKFFPENFKCWNGNKCIIMQLTKDSPGYKFMCEFRENCIYGDYCPGHNGCICTFRDEILPEKEEKGEISIIPPSLTNKLTELFA